MIGVVAAPVVVCTRVVQMGDREACCTRQVQRRLLCVCTGLFSMGKREACWPHLVWRCLLTFARGGLDGLSCHGLDTPNSMLDTTSLAVSTTHLYGACFK